MERRSVGAWLVFLGLGLAVFASIAGADPGHRRDRTDGRGGSASRDTDPADEVQDSTPTARPTDPNARTGDPGQPLRPNPSGAGDQLAEADRSGGATDESAAQSGQDGFDGARQGDPNAVDAGGNGNVVRSGLGQEGARHAPRGAEVTIKQKEEGPGFWSKFKGVLNGASEIVGPYGFAAGAGLLVFGVIAGGGWPIALAGAGIALGSLLIGWLLSLIKP